MQEALAKLEQEIKAVKRAGRLAKGVLEEGLEARSEAKELHAKFSVLFEALGHLSQALDTHYASLEDDDTQLEQALISLKRIKSKMATPLASLESASSAKEVLEALTSLEQGVLDLEGVLTSLKKDPQNSQNTPPPTINIAPKTYKRKYFPKNMEELKKLVKNENIHLGEIDIGPLENLSCLFYPDYPKTTCDRKNFEGIETWDVSNVKNMARMFHGCIYFNHDISNWDVSNVKCMHGMFEDCENFNQALDKWDVSNVEQMGHMFNGCKKFNQPLNSWDVSNVKEMACMFESCKKFNQPLNSWNTSKVEEITTMFEGCENFNGSLEGWDVSNVKKMDHMFNGCVSFNQPLNSWDVSNVETMCDMFQNCKSFNQPLNSWNVSKVKNMSEMFKYCESFNQPLDTWDVSSVEQMGGMFFGCKNFNQSLDSWQVNYFCILGKDTCTGDIFARCESLEKRPKWWYR
ncbi:hypothetical protein NHP21005_13850 [Helicobacter sp. NHP21005]|uniref:BspA family leucine-rich repeat surface protein n=1 Tax=Helicobacter felistomachi TaxID=3040201 RepID=UPI00257352FD|nr:BspA family leucine-rich repeat surface protein [Helicobacter sp. NHP21005]BEG57697.1 hypothetical protein NHP21005_13850 [Helicobacter sp. NHP21005]